MLPEGLIYCDRLSAAPAVHKAVPEDIHYAAAAVYCCFDGQRMLQRKQEKLPTQRKFVVFHLPKSSSCLSTTRSIRIVCLVSFIQVRGITVDRPSCDDEEVLINFLLCVFTSLASKLIFVDPKWQNLQSYCLGLLMAYCSH